MHHLDFFLNYLFLEKIKEQKQNNIFYHFAEIFVYLAYSIIIITVSHGLKFVPFYSFCYL